MPAIGEITGARVLAEFGDDPTRYTSAKARKNYAGTSPITRASGKGPHVQARYVRNNRLADALQRQAFCALQNSPGARRYYDKQRARDLDYNPALRHLGNRFVASSTDASDPHPLRRGHRMGPPRQPRRSLTPNAMGCLSTGPEPGTTTPRHVVRHPRTQRVSRSPWPWPRLANSLARVLAGQDDE